MVVSGFATLLLGASGWLGGELVYVHGVGVTKRDDLGVFDPRRRRAA